MLDTIGSDPLRWFLVSSPVIRGGELRIERDARQMVEVVRLVINPIWNAYGFFTLYANADGVRARERTDSTALLDRYVLAKTRELVEKVQSDLDGYELSGACSRVVSFIDALNNWYIRRSRDRVWRARGEGAADADKQAFYDTLYTVLLTLCRVASPLLPFVTEEIYRNLSDERSVHLSDWPDCAALPDEPELVADMDRARDACSAALALRAAKNARVRQPLASLTVAGAGSERLRPYLDLIADEVNVKEVHLTGEIEQYADFRLQVNARALGPRLGKDMKKVLAAAKQGRWERTPEGGGVVVDGVALAEGEYELKLEPKEGVACEALPGGDAIAVLDLDLSDELVQEGVARDVVRLVQQARKEAGLHVSDRIRLALELPADARAAVDRFRDYVSEQTLAAELELDPVEPDGLFRHEAALGGDPIAVALARI